MSNGWVGGSTSRWRKLRAYILRDNPPCWLCGLPGADSVDHVISLANGGAKYDIANCKPAHLNCNIKRGEGKGELPHKSVTEW